MNRILLLAFFCLPTFLFAQSHIELLGSLDYSYRTYSANDLLESIYNDIEKPKLNYHFSINYTQQLKEKWHLRIGVGLVSTGYKTKEGTELRFGSQHDGNGNFDPNLPGEFEFVQYKYNQQFLDIPIALFYQFSNKKITSSVGLGVSTLYYLQSSTKTFLDKSLQSKETFRDEEINQIQLAPTLALDFGYAFNEQWGIFLQPNFRFHLTKTYDGLATQHLWSGGVALGIRRKLKK